MFRYLVGIAKNCEDFRILDHSNWRNSTSNWIDSSSSDTKQSALAADYGKTADLPSELVLNGSHSPSSKVNVNIDIPTSSIHDSNNQFDRYSEGVSGSVESLVVSA